MATIVQKYGGTSVKDADRIKKVAQHIVKTKKKGNEVLVAVSAPAGMTDNLIKMADEISSNPHEREMDMLLSTGEQVSIALLAMAIYELDEQAISFTGAQVGIITDGKHTKAKIQSINAKKIKKEMDSGKIVIVAGFQGITKDKDITTLGRGGSDTTSVALAIAVGAKTVEIYTDVDGVYTADPRVVNNARKIENICYEEMLELAGSGAKVLHLRCVELAAKYNITINLRSSYELDKSGTIIKEEDKNMEKAVVRGIGHSKNEAKITLVGVPDQPGVAARIFEKVANEGINVDIIIQNLGADGKNDISFTIPSSDIKKAKQVTEKLRDEIGAKEVVSDEAIGKIAVVGVGMKSHPGVAATLFKALAEAEVNIEMISTSEIKIAVIIKECDLEKALQIIHNKFRLESGGIELEL